MAFTKEQDDIKEPKEFDYDYLLVLTKYTVPNELMVSIKPGKEPKRDDRIFYRWEDSVFEPRALISFSYQTTFKQSEKDGTHSWITGACAQAGGGREVQYRLAYLIEWS